MPNNKRIILINPGMLCGRIYLLMIGRNKYEPINVVAVLMSNKPTINSNNIFCLLRYFHKRRITCLEFFGFSTEILPCLPGSPAGIDFILVGSLMLGLFLLIPENNKSPGKQHLSLSIHHVSHCRSSHHYLTGLFYLLIVW